MCVIKELILTFDLRTIEHLGIQMYKTLPPVLAEMISNAYDADATCVDIKLLDDDPDNKQIIITDNGCGMTFQEINDSFLVIGKNRRKYDLNQTGVTPRGRKVTGRKGLGKLAVFGIANHIQIKTIKNGLLNIFDMDLNDILSENSGTYRPRILKFNEPTEETSGTKISLSSIKRKNPFDSSELKESIAKRFAFGVEDFFIAISKDKEPPLKITNNTKWEYINAQFEWLFDETSCSEDEFLCEKKIFGKVITTKTPLPEEQRGIFLYARGKLVNSNEFYGIKTTTSLAYNYMTGVFYIDFIDDDIQLDFVTTNREGLIWEREELQVLKKWLVEKIQSVEKQWSEKRTQLKEDAIYSITGYKPREWINTLPKRKQNLANNWISSIYKDNSINEEKAGELINHLQMCLKFDTFDDMVADLENSGLDEVKVLDLFKEWNLVEAQELYNLSRGRIKAIEKLEQFIKEDAKEVPTIHNFIKEFPWILDPKMTIYKDECTYSQLLQEKFSENEELLEENRRLDFLCTGFGDTLYIVELKRPSCRISQKEFSQLLKYHAFIKDHLLGTSEASYHQVASYIIGGSIVGNTEFNMQIEAMKTQRVYIEIYPEMLSRVKNYHKEFIDKYNELKNEAI